MMSPITRTRGIDPMRRRFAPPFSACLIAVVLVALTALPATAGNAYGHARAGKPAKHVVGADCGTCVFNLESSLASPCCGDRPSFE